LDIRKLLKRIIKKWGGVVLGDISLWHQYKSQKIFEMTTDTV